jgi:hypothetical protein
MSAPIPDAGRFSASRALGEVPAGVSAMADEVIE